MADRKQYVAIAPLVIAKEELGRDLYSYEGQPISEDATDESIANLLEGGFIKEVDAPAEAEAEKTLEDFTVRELKTEIDSRNEGREDADKIVPEAPGNRPELLAALHADDAKSTPAE